MIVDFVVPVRCETKAEAIEIQSHINSYGTLPGTFSCRVLKALAKHKNSLMDAGAAAQNGKMAILAQSPKIIAFVQDIIKG